MMNPAVGNTAGGRFGIARPDDPRYDRTRGSFIDQLGYFIGGGRHVCILDSEEDLLWVEMHLDDLIAELARSGARRSCNTRTPNEPFSEGNRSHDGARGHSPRGATNRQ